MEVLNVKFQTETFAVKNFADGMAKAALIFIPFVMHTAAQRISCLQ